MALETVAAVAAIVSAFQGAAALYNSWKARPEAARRATGAAPVNDGVTQQSLQLGGRSVQAEYDRALSRVGARFARGDGKANTSCTPHRCDILLTIPGRRGPTAAPTGGHRLTADGDRAAAKCAQSP